MRGELLVYVAALQHVCRLRANMHATLRQVYDFNVSKYTRVELMGGLALARLAGWSAVQVGRHVKC